jgi:hypothetical protein
MRAHPELFAGAPYSADELARMTNQYLNAREGEVVAMARAERANRRLDVAFDNLVRAAGVKPEDLPAVSEPPGQVGYLEVVRDGRGSVSLAWQEPRDGGAPAVYMIRTRKLDEGGEWQSVSATRATEATITGQESGVEYEYQVDAINRAGEGAASNTVRATP